MVLSIKNCFQAILAMALFISLAHAFTPQEEASFFAKTGENATAVAFGSGYQMVLINGVETAVLQKNGDEYAIIQDDAAIKTALDAYAKKSYEDLKPLIPQIVSNFNDLGTTIDDCIIGSKWFSFNLTRGGVYVKFNVRYDPAHFPKEWGAIWFINNNIGNFTGNWTIAQDAMASLQASANDQDKALAAAGSLRDSLGPIRDQYPKYYEAYLNATSSNQYAYRAQGVDRACQPTSNVTTSMNAILSLIGSTKYNSKDTLFVSVRAGTTARASIAVQNKIKTGASAVAGSLSSKVEGVKQNYSAYGIDLKTLSTELTNLQALVGTPGFSNASATLTAKVGKYQALLVDYNYSKYQISQADAAIAKAQDRYGSTDQRVVDLKKQLDDVKITLKQSETSLSSGNISSLNIKGIGQNAEIIANNARNLRAQENEIDFTTIAAVLVLLIALAGGYYYYRKQQGGGFGGNPPSGPAPKPALPIGGGGSSSSSLDSIPKM